MGLDLGAPLLLLLGPALPRSESPGIGGRRPSRSPAARARGLRHDLPRRAPRRRSSRHVAGGTASHRREDPTHPARRARRLAPVTIGMRCPSSLGRLRREPTLSLEEVDRSQQVHPELQRSLSARETKGSPSPPSRRASRRRSSSPAGSGPSSSRQARPGSTRAASGTPPAGSRPGVSVHGASGSSCRLSQLPLGKVRRAGPTWPS